jgi:hypothetical protein
VYITVNQFFKYEVQTVLSTESQNEIDFPAITVCNQNRMTLDYSNICRQAPMAMEKLVHFNIFYRNEQFRQMILKIVRQNETVTAFPREHPTEWLANLLNRNDAIGSYPVIPATDCGDRRPRFTDGEVQLLSRFV